MRAAGNEAFFSSQSSISAVLQVLAARVCGILFTRHITLRVRLCCLALE